MKKNFKDIIIYLYYTCIFYANFNHDFLHDNINKRVILIIHSEKFLSRTVTENHAVTWMKEKTLLYFEKQPQIKPDLSKRIVLLPNNSLAIYNATVDDSSDDYKCNILRQPENIYITHRLRVDPERTHQPSAASPPPQHSHKGIIRVIPSRRMDVNQGQTITFGCETDMQPPPEIKWFIEVKY